tara:strand:- start:315 stop:593 length:279 start_codon:yes stop_codon:yes gene_type:complete
MSDEERSPLKNDIYSTDNFDWQKWNQDDTDWNVTFKMNIKEARLMYSFVSFYLQNYMGAPGRPPEEEHYLPWLQKELYKMIQDYNFSHHTTA